VWQTDLLDLNSSDDSGLMMSLIILCVRSDGQKTPGKQNRAKREFMSDGFHTVLSFRIDLLTCQGAHTLYNDPGSATRRTGRNDCNDDAPAGFAGGKRFGRSRWRSCLREVNGSQLQNTIVNIVNLCN